MVIPVRDDAARLERCLRAITSQTLQAGEVIVVDDGSADATAEVAAAWGARVVRVQTASIPAAAAAGYDAARCSIIARLDADSVPPPGWLGAVVEAFRRRPHLAALTGPGVFARGRLRVARSAVYLGGYRMLAGAALGHAPLFGSNLAFRRDEWMRVAGEVHRDDPMIHDDFDLAYHLGPLLPIRWEPRLRVAIDAPSADIPSVLLRIRRGFRTVLIHWPQESPWTRWARRVRRAR